MNFVRVLHAINEALRRTYGDPDAVEEQVELIRSWLHESQRPRHPVGPCVWWARRLNRAGRTPADVVGFLERTGCSGVFIQTFWGGSRNGPDITQQPGVLTDYVAAIADAGIEPWLWGWVTPKTADVFYDHALMVLSESNARGYIVNAEKPWFAGQPECRASEATCRAQASLLVSLLRAGTDKPLGLTSYGRPDFHDAFPWAEFSGLDPDGGEPLHHGFDFLVPQAYDPKDRYRDGFVRRCVEDWRRTFGPKPVVVSLGLNSTDLRQMSALAAEVPSAREVVPATAHWTTTALFRDPKKRAWFREYAQQWGADGGAV